MEAALPGITFDASGWSLPPRDCFGARLPTTSLLVVTYAGEKGG